MLPQLTVLKLFDIDVHPYENRILYSSCREFHTESIFRTDLEPSVGASEPKTPVIIPKGMTIKIALHSKIDPERSFAGDLIEGQLLNALGSVVPAGAIVHGRIVRFEHQYQPSNYFALGLKFDSIDVNGSEVPLTLVAVTRSRGARIMSGFAEKRQGIGMFMFQTDRLVLDQKFVSEWKTSARKQPK